MSVADDDVTDELAQASASGTRSLVSRSRMEDFCAASRL
jgi:hypothetical protein